MVNLNDLLNTPPGQPIARCKFGPFISTLNEDDQNAVWRAFDNDDITTRHIFHILEGVGYNGGETSVRNHRSGRCTTCPRR